MCRFMVLVFLVVLVTPAFAVVDVDDNPVGERQPMTEPSTPTPIPREIQIFDDMGAFQAAAGPLNTEDLEDEATTAGCDGGGVDFIELDWFTAFSTPPALKVMDTECVGNHNTTPGGVKYLAADTDLGGVSAEVTFVFNDAILEFGLNVIDLDSAPLEIAIAGQVYTVAANGDGGVSFFGIIAEVPFTTVEMTIVGGSDSHWSVDDILSGVGSVPASTVSWGTVKAFYH